MQSRVGLEGSNGNFHVSLVDDNTETGPDVVKRASLAGRLSKQSAGVRLEALGGPRSQKKKKKKRNEKEDTKSSPDETLGCRASSGKDFCHRKAHLGHGAALPQSAVPSTVTSSTAS